MSNNKTIALLSDLHTEFYHDDSYLKKIPTDCNILILAGDIFMGHRCKEILSKISNHALHSEIIFIAGNHEFYEENIEESIQLFRDICVSIINVHFLEHDKITLHGITFIGCTLWTGFNSLGDDYIHENIKNADNSINDFFCIRTSINNIPFTGTHARYKFLESKKWLKQELEQHMSDMGSNNKTIVITHFPPALELKHERIFTDHLTAYFQADCLDLIFEFKPKIWIYGHNHWSMDKQLDQTRCISNQCGYPSEEESNRRYNEKLRLAI